MLENDKLSSNDKLRTSDCETMPNQIPPWTDFLSCSVCFHEFLAGQRSPILLGCGHTVCRGCLSTLNNKQCPYDQTSIAKDIENLPINYALLHIVSNDGHGKNVSHDAAKLLAVSKAETASSQKLKTLSPGDLDCYKFAKSSIENLALYLRSFVNGNFGSLLSRPIQRKLVILVNCQLMEDEGRLRALRVSRSLGERIVTEILILHQNPQQLSSNLWTAVRSRGCQFLGPAMQEEVLKLILLALEDGSALSRKVLVMFVVQRLELHFPQASKTSIGHVVQLLYRGSCFKVSKRKANSSLMQLKEEFRTYEALRREHDVQIVEIATETGLRIAPDQWSSILYGDNLHKSYMQSIIDKLQTSQSFAQALQELFIVLQRTGDPNNLSDLRVYLKHLSNIDLATESSYKNWKIIANSLDSVRKIVIRFIAFLQQHSNRKLQGSTIINPNVKCKMNLCKNVRVERICPCEISCTFGKSEDELENFRSQNRKKDLKFPEMVVSESLDVKLNSSGLHIPFSTTPLFSRISKSNVGYHCTKTLTPRAVLICGKQEAYFEKIGYRNQILRASKSLEDMLNKKSYGDPYASFKMSSPSSVTQSLVMKRLSSKPVELFSNIVEQMEPQVSTGKEHHQHHQSSFDYRFP